MFLCDVCIVLTFCVIEPPPDSRLSKANPTGRAPPQNGDGTVVPSGGIRLARHWYPLGIRAVDGYVRRGHIGVMDIAVLGPLEVDGTSTGFFPRDGVVLEALATHPGKVLSPE